MTNTASPLLIIYTGGTIGMTESREGLEPDQAFARTLKDALAQQGYENIDIITLQPLLDSATSQPRDWCAIINTIHTHASAYEGFVILHGTDTLAYTAAAVALWCDELGKPVVITGAQRPMHSADSDGLDNIVGAIRFVRHPEFKQVGVYFGGWLLNPRAVRKVHAQADQAFNTPNSAIWGEKIAHDYIFYREVIPPFATIAPLTHISTLLAPASRKSVALLHLTPGMAESSMQVAFDDNDAVVLLSYGVGNLPNNQLLREQINHAIQAHKLIINCTQCYQGHTAQTTYAAGVQNQGVLEGGYIGYEFAYVLSYFAAELALSTEAVSMHIRQLNDVLASNACGDLNQDDA